MLKLNRLLQTPKDCSDASIVSGNLGCPSRKRRICAANKITIFIRCGRMEFSGNFTSYIPIFLFRLRNRWPDCRRSFQRKPRPSAPPKQCAVNLRARNCNRITLCWIWLILRTNWILSAVFRSIPCALRCCRFFQMIEWLTTGKVHSQVLRMTRSLISPSTLCTPLYCDE